MTAHPSSDLTDNQLPSRKSELESMGWREDVFVLPCFTGGDAGNGVRLILWSSGDQNKQDREAVSMRKI